MSSAPKPMSAAREAPHLVEGAPLLEAEPRRQPPQHGDAIGEADASLFRARNELPEASREELVLANHLKRSSQKGAQKVRLVVDPELRPILFQPSKSSRRTSLEA